MPSSLCTRNQFRWVPLVFSGTGLQL